MGVILDISARKQAEGALEKARAEKQAILDNIPDMAWLKDKEDRLIAVNKAYCRACGRTQEGVLGKSEAEIWEGRRTIVMPLDDQEVLAAGEHLKLEETFMDSEANDTWLETIITPVFNETGAVIGSTGVARDITERRWMWEELNRSHKEIEHLFDSIPSIIIRLSPQGTILQCNKGAIQTLGVTQEQMLGQKLQDLPLSWDWQHIAEGLAQCQQTLDGLSLSDVRCQWRDGKERLLGLTLSPSRGGTEPLIGIILLGADITARRIMEGQLAQAQELESIGQLAGGIAHEINTPIQYVGDNTRFLLEATQDIFQLLHRYEDLLTEVEKGHLNENLCQSLRALQQDMDLEFLMGDIPRAAAETLDGVKRVAKIVRAMKEFSHPGSGNKTPIDINRTVENTITVARNEWKYVADMVTDLNPDLPLAPLLSDEFSQVLLNIIINAAHAIADVAAVQNGGKGTISIRTRRVGDEAEVCISDTGPGIPEAISGKIFDPFFTTKEVGRGTGQGLAIAHTIVVDKHGGRISFETEAGRGTTFIIRVPLEASSPGRQGTGGESNAARNSG